MATSAGGIAIVWAAAGSTARSAMPIASTSVQDCARSRLLSDLRQRFAKFNLELHPDKTRLIEFGRFAARNRAERGAGKSETFEFLGFTHLCGKTRDGRFWLLRITINKRMRAKLKQVKAELRRRCHWPIPGQGHWLASVLRGHFNYYAVPGNIDAVTAFRDQVRPDFGRSRAHDRVKVAVDLGEWQAGVIGACYYRLVATVSPQAG